MKTKPLQLWMCVTVNQLILQCDLELMHRELLYLWLSSFVCRNRTTEN